MYRRHTHTVTHLQINPGHRISSSLLGNNPSIASVLILWSSPCRSSVTVGTAAATGTPKDCSLKLLEWVMKQLKIGCIIIQCCGLLCSLLHFGRVQGIKVKLCTLCCWYQFTRQLFGIILDDSFTGRSIYVLTISCMEHV